jgi:hypothetical protein
MFRNQSGKTIVRNFDWDQMWTTESLLRAAHKPVKSGGAAVTASAGPNPALPNLPVVKSIQVRPLSRTHALWLLVGALWVSIGMIVSATLVTVAFLA